MPTPETDHESLIALHERVSQHQRVMDQLDAQGRDHALQLARLTTNIEGLQHTQTLIARAIEEVKQQQQEYQQYSTQQILNLDNKIDAGNTGIRDHFDEKFDAMHADVHTTMARKEAAVPQWAQVRLTALSIVVAVLGVIVAILGYFRVL